MAPGSLATSGRSLGGLDPPGAAQASVPAVIEFDLTPPITAGNAQDRSRDAVGEWDGLVVKGEETWWDPVPLGLSEETSPDEMGWLRDFSPAAASVAWSRVSEEERAGWKDRGMAVLNAPMVSAVCHDDDLDTSLVSKGSKAVAEKGLLGAIEEGLAKLRF